MLLLGFFGLALLDNFGLSRSCCAFFRSCCRSRRRLLNQPWRNYGRDYLTLVIQDLDLFSIVDQVGDRRVLTDLKPRYIDLNAFGNVAGQAFDQYNTMLDLQDPSVALDADRLSDRHNRH